MLFFILALLFAASPDLWAGGIHAGWNHRSGIRSSIHPPVREACSRPGRPIRWSSRTIRHRVTAPARRQPHPSFSAGHGRLTRRREEHHRIDRRHPGYWWPAGTIPVREVQPIVIVNISPPPEPPPVPEPQKVWVPPVIGTRTEAGYWDYEIKRVWRGDHWLYEQDFEKPRWVPPSQVEYVEQEGYWKIVE
jgi:hypothetical protein